MKKIQMGISSLIMGIMLIFTMHCNLDINSLLGGAVNSSIGGGLTGSIGSGSFLLSMTIVPVNPADTAGSLDIGQTVAYKAVGVNSDGTFSDPVTGVTWTSGNTGIMTVDTLGNITGVTAGNTTLIANANNVSAQINITVNTFVSTLGTNYGTISLMGGGVYSWQDVNVTVPGYVQFDTVAAMTYTIALADSNSTDGFMNCGPVATAYTCTGDVTISVYDANGGAYFTNIDTTSYTASPLSIYSSMAQTIYIKISPTVNGSISIGVQ